MKISRIMPEALTGIKNRYTYMFQGKILTDGLLGVGKRQEKDSKEQKTL